MYRGLSKSYEIDAGPRTLHTLEENVPLGNKLIKCKEERYEVKSEFVYPYSPQQCFDLMKDYRQFLLTHLKDNERMAKEATGKPFYSKPFQIGEEKGLGSRVDYAFFLDNVVYEKVDIVTDLEDGINKDKNGNKIYRFKVKTQDVNTKPTFPLAGFEMMMIFTTFARDPNKCHITWIYKWNKPYIGPMCVNDKYKMHFEAAQIREIYNFNVLLNTNYSPKLPKKDSKVLVIGAGPSGLHMTYELIQRGLNPANITILEKTERYGGKTLSIPSETNVQISDAKFNRPLPGFKYIKKAALKYRNLKADVERFLLTLYKIPIDEFQFERKHTPNALQEQPEDEYFRGGEKIFHELGTCYLSPSYYAIRTLLKQVQKQVEERSNQEANVQGKFTTLAEADLTREVGPDTYAIESKQWDKVKTLPEWVVLTGQKMSFWATLFGFSKTVTSMLVNGKTLAAKRKYCGLHEHLLGNYSYSMPPQPDDSRFDDLMTPFGTFLAQKKLQNLEPLFTYALTAQGYGIIKSTPTFLAMQWLTPDLLDGYFEWYAYFTLFYKNNVGEVIRPIPEHMKKYDNPRKGMLVAGWGGLWDRIVALYDLEDRIKYKTEVKEIKRTNGKVHAVYCGSDAIETTAEEFDYLVVGAPMSDPTEDPTVPTLPLDFTNEEKDLFLSEDMEASIFRTNLFLPEKNGSPESEADHLRIFIDEILQPDCDTPAARDNPETGKGRVFGVRDSYKAIQPRLSTKEGHQYDPRKDSPREKMCYQYVSPENVKTHGSQEYLTQLLVDFFKKHSEYFENTNGNQEEKINKIIKYTKQWPYYTHYKTQGLRKFKLWRILDIQGMNKTLFVHASTNFESVLDIVNYNNMLLDGLAGRLNNYITPERDTRPKPYQRAQKILFNQLILHKIIRYALNFVILILWSIYYILSYPYAEAVSLRKQRRELHVSFGGLDLPDWKDMDMKVFNEASPTIRGLFTLQNKEPNGIPDEIPEGWDGREVSTRYGARDHLFRMVEAPKNGFHKRYPNIPGNGVIEASIQYNLQDMRMATRHWLSTFKDGFQPLMTDKVQNMIEIFSMKYPNYYSWIFGWVFATQFRFLVGFAYRFEDEKGGGMRITNCHQLRVARRDYGERIAQKACFMVCKLITEEVMRNKGMKIDLQPDFITGSGTGCTIRMDNPVSHAYSDHSIEYFRTNEEKEEFEDIDVSW